MNLPNLISLARLLAAPLNVWLILRGDWTLAFVLFVLAGLSDAVDGFIAKRFGKESLVGRYLDPLADKALLVSIYVSLGVQSHIDLWLVILVVSRDVLIIGGALLLYMLNQRVSMSPLIISKFNTVAQISLAIVILGGLAFGVDGWRLPAQVLTVLVGATTVLSGGSYLVQWGRRMRDMEGAA